MNKILFISIIFLVTSCVYFKKNQPSKLKLQQKDEAVKTTLANIQDSGE